MITVKSQTEDFFTKQIFRNNFKLTLFLISISILLIVFKFKDLAPEIPLFYSLAWGEKQLANKLLLFLLPIFSLLVLLFNTFLAKKIKEDELIAKFLIGGSLLFSLLSAVTLFKIVFLAS